MENFSPLSGFIGGLLIGGSATLFVLIAGRIAGISGIVGGALAAVSGDRMWRIAFIAGLVLGPLMVTAVSQVPATIQVQAGVPLLVVAGLLVGFGTRMGNGCTSGHGVCGIARGSPRSLAATGVFFATALVTVFIHRHLLGG